MAIILGRRIIVVYPEIRKGDDFVSLNLKNGLVQVGKLKFRAV